MTIKEMIIDAYETRDVFRKEYYLQSKNEKIRASVAKNENVDLHFLEYLAKNDKSKLVRRCVAINRSVDLEILEVLSNDIDEDVRYSVCGNKNVSYEILEKLSKDKSIWVSGIAKIHLKEYFK